MSSNKNAPRKLPANAAVIFDAFAAFPADFMKDGRVDQPPLSEPNPGVGGLAEGVDPHSNVALLNATAIGGGMK